MPLYLRSFSQIHPNEIERPGESGSAQNIAKQPASRHFISYPHLLRALDTALGLDKELDVVAAAPADVSRVEDQRQLVPAHERLKAGQAGHLAAVVAQVATT